MDNQELHENLYRQLWVEPDICGYLKIHDTPKY